MSIHYRINGHIDIYLIPLTNDNGTTRRQREEQAEKMLLNEIFGQETALQHHTDGSPYIPTFEGTISISHSKHHLCIALSEKKQVGVDIEEIQERLMRLRKKFLSADELAHLSPTLRNLTLCWSAKEAIYKIAGEKAGAMGQNITLDTTNIGNGTYFNAQIGNEHYRLTVVTANDTYTIVTAEQNERIL